MTIGAVLTHSKSPRGSIYHHFPDGRSQILAEALGLAGDVVSSALDEAMTEGPSAVLHGFVTLARASASYQGDAHLPAVIAAATESGMSNELTEQASTILTRWTSLITTSVESRGVERERAFHFAARAMTTIVGVVALRRVLGTTTPLDDIVDELALLLHGRAGGTLPVCAVSMRL